MDAETTQTLEAVKKHIDEELAKRHGPTAVQQVIDAHEATRKKQKDDEWDKLKRRLVVAIIGVLSAGGLGTGAYVRYAPDEVDQQKKNDLVHEKLGAEIVKSRGQMLKSVQYLGEKMDALAEGEDPADVAPPVELVQAEAELIEKERKAEALELLELDPAEMEKVKK